MLVVRTSLGPLRARRVSNSFERNFVNTFLQMDILTHTLKMCLQGLFQIELVSTQVENS